MKNWKVESGISWDICLDPNFFQDITFIIHLFLIKSKVNQFPRHLRLTEMKNIFNIVPRY